MKNTIFLVDETEIPSSFDNTRLLVNGEHILSSDEQNVHPVKDVAESLSTALNAELKEVKVTSEQLAYSIVKHDPVLKDDFEEDLKSGETDFDEWCQGYTNNDILNYINDLD